MIVDNPFTAIVRPPADPGRFEHQDRPEARRRAFDTLRDLVGLVSLLLGGKLIEFHEDETLSATGVTIKHNLGRQPRGFFLYRLDTGRVVFGNHQLWTDTEITLQSSAGTPVVSYVLF